MRRKYTIVAASIFSLVSADQAMADNGGAALIGGLIGGAIGSAISNSHQRSYSGSSRRTSRQPSAPWSATPMPNNTMMVTNGQGVTFTSRPDGSPQLIVQPSAFIPPAAVGTQVPVSVVIDGRVFGILQADVQQASLEVNDLQVVSLEQQLKPAREMTLTSAFATLTVSLSGFTKSIQQLAMFRQQQAMLAAATPQPAPAAPAPSTVVQVQVNGAASTAAQSTGEGDPDMSEQQVATADTSVSVDIKDADSVNRRLGELQVEIEILTKVLGEQKAEKETATDPEQQLTLEETINALTSHIQLLEREYDAKNQKFEVYLTSVKPNDKDLYLTARKASQVFPKVPYYIPGTKEQGEFWLEPKVTSVGELMFNFRLVDPAAENETTRDLIEVNLDQLETIRNALVKLRKNSQIAHEKKIRKIYSKRMTCFPEGQCPEERQNGEKGKSSTEVVFLIYEDGSTAGRLQLNKGAFQDGVNFSVDSALLLQAYLAHVIKEAKLEFNSGSQTQKDLDEMFQ